MTDYGYAEPKSFAEMNARYEAIRRKFFPAQKRKKAPRKITYVAPVTYLCQRDAHVADYRLHLKLREADDADREARVKRRKYQTFKVIAEDILSNEPDFTWLDIIGPSRTRSIVTLRQAIIHTVKAENKGLSLPLIGRMCGGRDHTTMLHAIRSVNAAITAGNGEWRKTPTGREYFVRNVSTAHYGRGAHR